MTWEKLASPATLSSTADVISSGTFTAKKHLYFEAFLVNSGSIMVELKLGSGGSIDTGSNYSTAWTRDGGSQSYRQGGHDSIESETYPSSNAFVQGWIDNTSAGRKLAHLRLIYDGGTDVVPTRVEIYGKWDNTTAQANVLEIFNNGSGDFTTGSKLVVWGTDGGVIPPSLSNGTIFEESDTGKHYMFDGTSTWNEVT